MALIVGSNISDDLNSFIMTKVSPRSLLLVRVTEVRAFIIAKDKTNLLVKHDHTLERVVIRLHGRERKDTLLLLKGQLRLVLLVLLCITIAHFICGFLTLVADGAQMPATLQIAAE